MRGRAYRRVRLRSLPPSSTASAGGAGGDEGAARLCLHAHRRRHRGVREVLRPLVAAAAAAASAASAAAAAAFGSSLPLPLPLPAADSSSSAAASAASGWRSERQPQRLHVRMGSVAGVEQALLELRIVREQADAQQQPRSTPTAATASPPAGGGAAASRSARERRRSGGRARAPARGTPPRPRRREQEGMASDCTAAWSVARREERAQRRHRARRRELEAAFWVRGDRAEGGARALRQLGVG